MFRSHNDNLRRSGHRRTHPRSMGGHGAKGSAYLAESVNWLGSSIAAHAPSYDEVKDFKKGLSFQWTSKFSC